MPPPRFFRVIGSGESGIGLGWSIAQRMAGVLRAEFQVHPSAALGGLAVRLRFPAGRAVAQAPSN